MTTPTLVGANQRWPGTVGSFKSDLRIVIRGGGIPHPLLVPSNLPLYPAQQVEQQLGQHSPPPQQEQVQAQPSIGASFRTWLLAP